MKHLRKVGIILIVGITLILLQQYELKQNKQQSFETRQQVELVRVVDGDTVVVRTKSGDEKVRIVGMNTPESVKPHSPVECFGKEATEHIIQLLDQPRELFIQTDPTQSTRDRNGRLLAHIFINEQNIAQQMIADGYAYEYTYRDPYIYQAEYKNAQYTARKNNLGLWSPETCNGQK